MDNARKAELVGKMRDAYSEVIAKAFDESIGKITLEDRSNAMSAALESVLAEMGWRPIETAPRDGTKVLLLMNNFVWNSSWANYGYNNYVNYCWGTTDDGYFSRNLEPTHWMILDTLPKT